MVELRVPDRMAVLPVVMVVVMALLVVPQAKAQAVELAQMVAQVPVTQVGILEVAQLVGIPALVPMVGKQVVVLLTDPEAQVVQQMVAQVTAQREALQTEAVVMALDQLEVQVVLTGEQLMVPVPDQPEVPQVVQLTVPEAQAVELAQMVETVMVLTVAIAVVVLVMVQVQAEVMEQVTVATALTVVLSLTRQL